MSAMEGLDGLGGLNKSQIQGLQRLLMLEEGAELLKRGALTITLYNAHILKNRVTRGGVRRDPEANAVLRRNMMELKHAMFEIAQILDEIR